MRLRYFYFAACATLLFLFTACCSDHSSYRHAVHNLNAQIAEITPRLPMQLNECTWLTGMSYDDERRQICYRYTISEPMASVLNAEGREEIHNGILHSLHRQLPESRDFTSTMQQYDIMYHYDYRDDSGKPLFSFTITPEEVLTDHCTGAVVLPESKSL